MPSSHLSSIQDNAEGVLLTVHVQPNAARSNYVGVYGDALKIRIASPPVDGAANEALRRFLSEQNPFLLRSVCKTCTTHNDLQQSSMPGF